MFLPLGSKSDCEHRKSNPYDDPNLGIENDCAGSGHHPDHLKTYNTVSVSVIYVDM